MIEYTPLLDTPAQLFDELGEDGLVDVPRRESGSAWVGGEVGPVDGEAGYFC